MRAPAAPSIESFYRAAVVGLRVLEAREGRARRFGQVADDTWKALGGDFEDRDRLDLLLRDAAVAQPLAFAARAVFDIAGLAEDEPLGPDWPQAPGRLATDLLRQAREGGFDPTSALEAAASSWGLAPLRPAAGTSTTATALASLGPATKLLVAGASAIAALSEAAAGRRDLDLADQVVLVTGSPAERQLFGLALVLAATRTPPRVALPGAAAAALGRLGWRRVDVVLLGSDAEASSRAAAQALGLELGATSVVSLGAA